MVQAVASHQAGLIVRRPVYGPATDDQHRRLPRGADKYRPGLTLRELQRPVSLRVDLLEQAPDPTTIGRPNPSLGDDTLLPGTPYAMMPIDQSTT